MCVCVKIPLHISRHLKPTFLPNGNVAGSPGTENHRLPQIQHRKGRKCLSQCSKNRVQANPLFSKRSQRNQTRKRNNKREKNPAPINQETGEGKQERNPTHKPARSSSQQATKTNKAQNSIPNSRTKLQDEPKPNQKTKAEEG